MSNVKLSIGGRIFTVACAEGEENHVSALGAMIDGKITDAQDVTTLSEPRLLLYAALLLADELHEARQSVAAPAAPPAALAPALGSEAAQRFEAIAVKMENLASRLEGRDDNP